MDWLELEQVPQGYVSDCGRWSIVPIRGAAGGEPTSYLLVEEDVKTHAVKSRSRHESAAAAAAAAAELVAAGKGGEL